MFKKLSTIKLLAILGGLIAVYAIVQLTKGTGRSKSYRETLVEIDTSQVTKIEIFGTEEDVVLTKEADGNWKVGDKPGAGNTINGFLNTLQTIVPSRIASRKEDKWKDFQVDSTGTRVKVYEGAKDVLDIIIGRFGVEGQRSFYSYVRLFEESDTYVADNFMGMSLGKRSADFRNGKVITIAKDSIASIDFNYPDSTYSLLKSLEGAWVIDGLAADSAQVAKYLNGLSYVNNRNFTEGVGLARQFDIVYHLNGSEDVTVTSYGGNILNASTNDVEYFDDKALRDKFFKGKDYFLNP